MTAHTQAEFDKFMSTLQKTNRTLNYYFCFLLMIDFCSVALKFANKFAYMKKKSYLCSRKRQNIARL